VSSVKPISRRLHIRTEQGHRCVFSGQALPVVWLDPKYHLVLVVLVVFATVLEPASLPGRRLRCQHHLTFHILAQGHGTAFPDSVRVIFRTAQVKLWHLQRAAIHGEIIQQKVGSLGWLQREDYLVVLEAKNGGGCDSFNEGLDGLLIIGHGRVGMNKVGQGGAGSVGRLRHAHVHVGRLRWNSRVDLEQYPLSRARVHPFCTGKRKIPCHGPLPFPFLSEIGPHPLHLLEHYIPVRRRSHRLLAPCRLSQGPFVMLLEMINAPEDLASLMVENREILIRGGNGLVCLVDQLFNWLHPSRLSREAVDEKRGEIVVGRRIDRFLSIESQGAVVAYPRLPYLFPKDDSRDAPSPLLPADFVRERRQPRGRQGVGVARGLVFLQWRCRRSRLRRLWGFGLGSLCFRRGGVRRHRSSTCRLWLFYRRRNGSECVMGWLYGLHDGSRRHTNGLLAWSIVG